MQVHGFLFQNLGVTAWIITFFFSERRTQRAQLLPTESAIHVCEKPRWQFLYDYSARTLRRTNSVIEFSTRLTNRKRDSFLFSTSKNQFSRTFIGKREKYEYCYSFQFDEFIFKIGEFHAIKCKTSFILTDSF